MTSPISSFFDRPMDLEALLKGNNISSSVQRHLANVYGALAATIIASTLGAVLDLKFHVGGFVTFLAGLGALLWLKFDHDKTKFVKRTSILLLFGLLQGLSLGMLVSVILEADPSILLTSMLATTTVFVCFALAALLAKRRSYLYLGGILSSSMLVLLAVSVFNLYMESPLFFGAQLYMGLAIFCGYVVFDTQLIVEKASMGDQDFPWHAAELFIDFVAIFVRISIILLNKKGSSSSRRTRDRDSYSSHR